MASGNRYHSSSFPGSRGAGFFGGRYGSGDPYQSTLHSVSSWGSWSSGMDMAYILGARMKKQYQELEKNASAFQLQARQRRLGGFYNSISSVGKGIGGNEGVQIRAITERAIRDIEAKGGTNISNKDLAHSINDLMSQLRPIASSMSGNQGDLIRNVVMSSLRDAREGAAKGGINGLTDSTKSIQGTADKIKAFRYLEATAKNIATGAERVANTLSDNGIKSALTLLKDNLLVTANSAKTLAEKQKALSDFSNNVSVLARTATGTDKTALENLSTKTQEKKNEADKGLRYQKLHRVLLKGQQITLQSIKGVAFVGKQLPVLKRSFDVVAQGFSFVNDKANAFARTQMAIASERGAYGRQLRGAGINPHNMMAALAAGRWAGMDDRTVINQMVGLQEQLALARWGESPLINKAGRWGISVYDDRGHTKSNDQMMIEYSRKLNSLTDQAEKLQFLSHMGFRPEQMEYVQNYEREAKRFEEIKRNPSLRGVLEDARILDESGYYAKADAATKIELKRRQILNQNAIDEGVLPAIVRGLHPENWFFSDWTARQQGVESAKSEIAIKKLNEELEKVRGELSKNSGALSSNTSNLISLDAKTLAGLSLSGGWATADLANKGSKSSVHDLRIAYAQAMGTENLDRVDSRKNTATWLGGLGAAGAVLGIAAATSGIGLIPLLIAGLAGGAAAFGISNIDFDDGTEKHVDKLRELAKGKKWKEIEEYTNKHGLVGLTPEQILSDEFMKDDTKAKERVSGAWLTGDMMEGQALTNEKLDLAAAANYTSDKYYQANLRAARERGFSTVTDKQRHEAYVRSGTSNKTFGVTGDTLANFITYGFNENDPENIKAINERIGQLRSMKENEGKDFGVLRAQAVEYVKSKWAKQFTEDQLQEAEKNLKERKSGIDEERVRKELKLLGFGEGGIQRVLKMSNEELKKDATQYRYDVREGKTKDDYQRDEQIADLLDKLAGQKEKEGLVQREQKQGLENISEVRRLQAKYKQEQEEKDKKDKGSGGGNNPPPPPDTSKSSLQEEGEWTEDEKKMASKLSAEGSSMEAAYAANKKKAPLAQRSDIRRMRELVESGATREELIRHFGRDRYEQFAQAHPEAAKKAHGNSGLGVDLAAADQARYKKEDEAALVKAAREEKEALKSTDEWNRRQGLGAMYGTDGGLGGGDSTLGVQTTLGPQTILGGGQIRLEGIGKSKNRPTVVGEGNWGGNQYAKIKPKKTEIWDANGEETAKNNAIARAALPLWKEGMSEDEYIEKWKERQEASSATKLWENDDRVYDENGNVISDEQRADAEFAAQNGGPKIYTRAELEEAKERKRFKELSSFIKRTSKKEKSKKGKQKGKGEVSKTDKVSDKPGFPLEGMPSDTEKDAVKDLTEKEKQTAQATEAMSDKTSKAEAAAASGNAKTSGGDTINKENNITVTQTFNQSFNNSNGDYQAAKEGAEAGGKEGANTMTSAVISTTPGGVGTL